MTDLVTPYPSLQTSATTIPEKQMDKGITFYNVLETIRNEIQAEHTLISHRLTWYVTSQSFLMAAYAVSLSENHHGRVFFRHAVPWLSVVLSILAGVSVGCAIDAQWNVIKRQSEILVEMIKEYITAGQSVDPQLKRYATITCGGREGTYKTHWLAMTPPFMTPVVFAVLWICAYGWSSYSKLEELASAKAVYYNLLVIGCGIVLAAIIAGIRWWILTRAFRNSTGKELYGLLNINLPVGNK